MIFTLCRAVARLRNLITALRPQEGVWLCASWRGESGAGAGVTTTWRANYACRPGHLIGVFKGHTRTSHSQSFCASAYATPPSPHTPILWRLDPLPLYLLECFEIFERMRALLLWLWVGFFHWGLTTRSTVSKVPTRGDRLKDIDWKLYRVLEWSIFIILLGYNLKYDNLT